MILFTSFLLMPFLFSIKLNISQDIIRFSILWNFSSLLKIEGRKKNGPKNISLMKLVFMEVSQHLAHQFSVISCLNIRITLFSFGFRSKFGIFYPWYLTKISKGSTCDSIKYVDNLIFSLNLGHFVTVSLTILILCRL